MQGTQKIKPDGSINVDIADKYLSPAEKRFALNCDRGKGYRGK